MPPTRLRLDTKWRVHNSLRGGKMLELHQRPSIGQVSGSEDAKTAGFLIIC